jgi:hypothetical protein
MAEIVKLGKLRKERERAQKKARADANAVAFGRTKAEKAADRARAEQARKHIEGHKRDGDER